MVLSCGERGWLLMKGCFASSTGVKASRVGQVASLFVVKPVDFTGPDSGEHGAVDSFGSG